MQKRSKNLPTDSYFYLARHLAKCMMIFNSHVGPVRMIMTSTQNIPNSQVYSSDESESKSINADKSLSHICYKDEIKPKELFSMHVIQVISNTKVFTQVSIQTK